MAGTLKALIRALNPFRPHMSKHACWVCGVPVEFLPEDIQLVSHQCALGRGMSFTACEECRSRRGTTPDELANMIVYARTTMNCLPGEDDWELTEAQWVIVENELGFRDAHGARYGQPVHFWYDGRYYTIKEWVTTAGYSQELDQAKIRYMNWWSQSARIEATAS